MKLVKLLLCLGFLAPLSSCEKDKPIRMHGTMSYVPYKGYKCWVFKADGGRFYEVVTPSDQILKEGFRMAVVAVPVDKHTFCGLGDTIEIVKFRPDSDMYEAAPKEPDYLK